MEEDPYADIKLEGTSSHNVNNISGWRLTHSELLAPLASAADLPTHPSLSVAYTSKHLTNLTNEAGAFSRKEQVSLWRAKTLMTKLIGDMSYVPMGLPDLDANEHIQDSFTNGTNGTKTQATNGHVLEPEVIENGTAVMAPDTVMQDAEQPNGDAGTESITAQNGLPEVITNGDSHEINPDEPQENGDQPLFPAVEEADDGSDTASQQTTHRMTTRRGARAQAASDPSPPSSPSSIVNPIHPLFTFPTDSLPDRDFGLPATEAEDTRLLLLAFVQKQEEIKRAAEDLYLGMLQAERMRQDVFKWSKAEAHVGELSDGEDWYDREEWSLETDLLKGRDEEEDETQVTGKKSTRQRRTKPDKEDR